MDQNKQELRGGSRRPEKRCRRRYTAAQKMAIVRECLEPGSSLAGVALAHGANANMVRKWVVKFQRGGFGEASQSGMALLPVVVQKRPAARLPVKVATPTATLELPASVDSIGAYRTLTPHTKRQSQTNQIDQQLALGRLKW